MFEDLATCLVVAPVVQLLQQVLQSLQEPLLLPAVPGSALDLGLPFLHLSQPVLALPQGFA